MTQIETIVGKDFPKKVMPFIDHAVNSIDIIVFDWRWYPQNPGASVQLFNQAILRAVRRKVKVRVIANSDKIINILKAEGCQVKKLTTKKLVHCKMMIVDEQIAIVGSHNYTESAFQWNLELSVVFDSPSAIAECLVFLIIYLIQMPEVTGIDKLLSAIPKKRFSKFREFGTSQSGFTRYGEEDLYLLFTEFGNTTLGIDKYANILLLSGIYRTGNNSGTTKVYREPFYIPKDPKDPVVVANRQKNG